MIGYLKGQVLENVDGHVILKLNTSSDPDSGVIGYSVTVPGSPSYLGVLPGKVIEFFVYTHVREDSLDLYGFLSRGEKELFLTLLTVNGIGPKGALSLLSKVEPSTLIQAILDRDKDSLVQIPGIGKKTAERVVLELGDAMKKKIEAGVFSEVRVLSTGNSKHGPPAAKNTGEQAMFRDAKDALLGLGYREQEIVGTLNKLLADQVPPRRVEDLVRTALQRLG